MQRADCKKCLPSWSDVPDCKGNCAGIGQSTRTGRYTTGQQLQLIALALPAAALTGLADAARLGSGQVVNDPS